MLPDPAPHPQFPGTAQLSLLTQLTVWPRPPQTTGTAAIDGVAQAPVPADTLLLTAHAEPVLGAAWGAGPGLLEVL